MEAHPARAVTGRVQHLQGDPGELDGFAGGQVAVGGPPGMYVVPQHPVVGVQGDRCAGGLGQIDGGVDVVVVPVGTYDLAHPAVADRLQDGAGIVSGVDHHHRPALLAVTDQPDVVLDLEVAAVEGEDARGAHPLDAQAQGNTTTERRTSPRSILANASSTWSRATVSETKPSRSNFPRR